MKPAVDDPLILALVTKLPPTDGVFTSGDRERWLAAMDAVLQLLYPPEWTPDARRKAKEARSEPVEAITTTVTMDPDVVRRMTESWPRHLAPLRVTKEEPSTTSADAVDDESGGEADTASGAGPVPDTSERPPKSSPAPATGQDISPTSPSMSAPTSPSAGDPAPALVHDPKLGTGVRIEPTPRDPATPYARRHFTADQKGALLRRVVREGLNTVAQDAMIHDTTLRRWMREMPISVQTFTEEWEAEQKAAAIAEGTPTVAELEAEKETPVPSRMTEDMQRRAAELAAKPAVQWPTAPMERRPVDHAAVLRSQADQV